MWRKADIIFFKIVNRVKKIGLSLAALLCIFWEFMISIAFIK